MVSAVRAFTRHYASRDQVHGVAAIHAHSIFHGDARPNIRWRRLATAWRPLSVSQAPTMILFLLIVWGVN